ncbi:hypothetical protein JN086_08895 [Mycolicibacterium austroafricanum]|uniref:Uncharacterized protein n=1 Tax=Mycolicibacterium austroafricanum TaxID=39687 RepID=A0ABT8HD05_MYCAO|nr:hypothetical protein [Mycolicibacterium austroafricanum]MDN4518651.1 hypothetical protein [Mycolicibacterium austroafricanum]QRZ08439.1 hypothetical protein JN090_07950 [Mycolicibacterium austroafricanum]QZT70091.1 hypothetical protein JN086_08895 [Mycolicibacterium austroafricanum]
MNSNVFEFFGVAAGMSRTLDAQFWAHPAHPIPAAAAAAPRKRAAAGTIAASVRGHL